MYIQALANQLVADKKYSEAINYYLEAGDTKKAEEAAGSVLDEYMATGMCRYTLMFGSTWSNNRIPGQIEPLKTVHPANEGYTPDGNYWVLVEYNEFHRLYKVKADFPLLILY